MSSFPKESRIINLYGCFPKRVNIDIYVIFALKEFKYVIYMVSSPEEQNYAKYIIHIAYPKRTKILLHILCLPQKDQKMPFMLLISQTMPIYAIPLVPTRKVAHLKWAYISHILRAYLKGVKFAIYIVPAQERTKYSIYLVPTRKGPNMSFIC